MFKMVLMYCVRVIPLPSWSNIEGAILFPPASLSFRVGYFRIPRRPGKASYFPGFPAIHTLLLFQRRKMEAVRLPHNWSKFRRSVKMLSGVAPNCCTEVTLNKNINMQQVALMSHVITLKDRVDHESKPRLAYFGDDCIFFRTKRQGQCHPSGCAK